MFAFSDQKKEKKAGPLWKKVSVGKYGLEGDWCSVEVKGELWHGIVEGYEEGFSFNVEIFYDLDDG